LRAGPATADTLPEFQAEDTTAAPVTERNLLSNERFWPYQAALTRPWSPGTGREALSAGVPGVVIRIEESGSARIDFGRDGRYDVPVGATDLVERANRIRLGELPKLAPNFVLAIGPRLVDSASPTLRPFGLRAAGEQRGFLAVFADPTARDFADLALALSPLRERDAVLTILFPQGEHPDSHVRERLRALRWPVPFVYDHLAEAYTATLLPETTRPPALVLQTRVGRLIFQSPWKPSAVAGLRSALERSFGHLPPLRGPRPSPEARRVPRRSGDPPSAEFRRPRRGSRQPGTRARLSPRARPWRSALAVAVA
jgi:hypothetical protein